MAEPHRVLRGVLGCCRALRSSRIAATEPLPDGREGLSTGRAPVVTRIRAERTVRKAPGVDDERLWCIFRWLMIWARAQIFDDAAHGLIEPL